MFGIQSLINFIEMWKLEKHRRAQREKTEDERLYDPETIGSDPERSWMGFRADCEGGGGGGGRKPHKPNKEHYAEKLDQEAWR